jgi:hypothetical protein
MTDLLDAARVLGTQSTNNPWQPVRKRKIELDIYKRKLGSGSRRLNSTRRIFAFAQYGFQACVFGL